MLPRCNVCGVEYVEDHEGPCTEMLAGATYLGDGRWSAYCRGDVSYKATAEALAEELAAEREAKC